jgi:preprotein translocase subunit YajC
MFFSDAFAQTTGGAAAAGPDAFTATLVNIFPLIAIGVIFYFLLIRPQQRRMKEMQTMIAGIRKNDVIVTNGGMIGKVKSVADDELRIEIAPNVDIRIERSAVASVRNRTEPAPANDTKPSKSDQ